MKALAASVLLLSLAAPMLAAEAGDVKPVASRITEVTVYADRARVTRTAVNVPLGGRAAFTKLPGWIDEGSVRVAIQPPDAGELADVQIEKTFLARPDNEEIRKAEACVMELAGEFAELDDEAASLDAQSRQTESIRVFSMDKFPKDAAVREVKVEEYAGVVKFIGNSVLEIARARRVIARKRQELQPEMTARQRTLDELRQRAQLEQRTVVVTTAAKPGVTATVILTYMLPGTTWAPIHELRAAPDADTVTMTSYASVSQGTGEDWEGVSLAFSTQCPGTTERIPELEALLLGSGRSLARAINPNADTFGMAVDNYKVANGEWNRIANKGFDQQQWADNIAIQTTTQRQIMEVFRRVQQRGTTALFAAHGAQTVRTDGQPVRVIIGQTQLSSTHRVVAAPELSLNAVHTADLANAGNQPLLPGKVLLYTEGAFIGTTETDFVAPGENFSAFLGVADCIKLERTLDKKRSSLSWSGKRKRMLVSFLITVENLADKTMTLQLADRVPVSEIEDIRVNNIRIQPEVKPDAKGILKWDIALAPKEKREFRIEYTLEYPADFLQRAATNADDLNAPGRAEMSKQIKTFESAMYTTGQ